MGATCSRPPELSPDAESSKSAPNSRPHSHTASGTRLELPARSQNQVTSAETDADARVRQAEEAQRVAEARLLRAEEAARTALEDCRRDHLRAIQEVESRWKKALAELTSRHKEDQQSSLQLISDLARQVADLEAQLSEARRQVGAFMGETFRGAPAAGTATSAASNFKLNDSDPATPSPAERDSPTHKSGELTGSTQAAVRASAGSAAPRDGSSRASLGVQLEDLLAELNETRRHLRGAELDVSKANKRAAVSRCREEEADARAVAMEERAVEAERQIAALRRQSVSPDGQSRQPESAVGSGAQRHDALAPPPPPLPKLAVLSSPLSPSAHSASLSPASSQGSATRRTSLVQLHHLDGRLTAAVPSSPMFSSTSPPPSA